MTDRDNSVCCLARRNCFALMWLASKRTHRYFRNCSSGPPEAVEHVHVRLSYSRCSRVVFRGVHTASDILVFFST